MSLTWRVCTLDGLAPVTTEFAIGVHPKSEVSILRMSASGVADNSANAFELLTAMIYAGLEAWQPAALLLDFSSLRYEWGDGMANVLSASQSWFAARAKERELLAKIFGEAERKEFPTVVVTSQLNHDGLASLLRDEMKGGPLLCASIELAVEALDRRLTT